MNLSEGRGNEGDLGLLEVVWNDLGKEAAEAANWGGEFDGIRSDVDFRRALAIEGLTREVTAKATASVKAHPPEPITVLSRAAKAMRAMGEALSAWRAIRLPLR